MRYFEFFDIFFSLFEINLYIFYIYFGFLFIYQIIFLYLVFILFLVNYIFFQLENDFVIYVRFGDFVNVIVGLIELIEYFLLLFECY